jgi:hypothetical protein
MAKAAETIDEPCAWIRRLTPSVATLEEKPALGLHRIQEFNNRMQQGGLGNRHEAIRQVCDPRLKYLTGGAAIDSTS